MVGEARRSEHLHQLNSLVVPLSCSLETCLTR